VAIPNQKLFPLPLFALSVLFVVILKVHFSGEVTYKKSQRKNNLKIFLKSLDTIFGSTH